MQKKHYVMIIAVEAVIIMILGLTLLLSNPADTVDAPVEESNMVLGSVGPKDLACMINVPTIPLATPTPTMTPIPTPTPSPSPTPTPTPSPEPTPTPTPTVGGIRTYEENLDREYALYEVHESYGTYMLDAVYQDYTYATCEKYGIVEYYKLMLALMWHESNYKVNDISDTNDYGLCQINVCNHKWLKQTLDIDPDFLNPYTSIECGTYMLSSYLKKYEGDVHKALVAYNKGTNVVANGTTESAYSRVIVDVWRNKLVEITE